MTSIPIHFAFFYLLSSTSQYKFGFRRARKRNKIFSNLRHRGSEKLIQPAVIASEIINSCIVKSSSRIETELHFLKLIHKGYLVIFFLYFHGKKLCDICFKFLFSSPGPQKYHPIIWDTFREFKNSTKLYAPLLQW